MRTSPKEAPIDLAVVGGGAAGTYVADAVRRAHRTWSMAIFERTGRIGGRLRSQRIDGAGHPIELGGMRYLTSQPLVSSVIERFGIPTHPFDATGGADRSVLRGVVGTGATDAAAGSTYDLPPGERGRSAYELVTDVFERIVPGFRQLGHAEFVELRARGTFQGRPIRDWAIGDALAAVLSPEGHRFVVDAFGYDSGMRAFNAPDFVEFLFSGGDPNEEARTPDDGMDRIPAAMASAFEAAGGQVLVDHELVELTIDADAGGVVLAFANGPVVRAARVVLAMPVPALRRLARTSGPLAGPPFERVYASVEGFAAMKLYLWYAEPWWRPAVAGIRTITDLPLRKVFYFDGPAESAPTLLAMYTDGRDVQPWARLYEGGAPGAPAPPSMLAEVHRQLRETHPEVGEIPAPIGSALMYWGADDHETAWHFWRGGASSDEILRIAPRPDPALPIYLANEAFSRRQSWVEGAFEAAEAVVDRLGAGHV